eukprot:7296885-Prymnesium_polylepis.1
MGSNLTLCASSVPATALSPAAHWQLHEAPQTRALQCSHLYTTVSYETLVRGVQALVSGLWPMVRRKR